MERAWQIVLPASLAFLVSSCEKASDIVDETLHPNSTLLVSRCVERNLGQFPDPGAARKACAAKYDMMISSSSLTGTARIWWGEVSGEISNGSGDYVVTELVLSVDHKWNLDAQGNRISMIISIPGLWIGPNSQGSFAAKIPIVPPVLPASGDWGWSIVSAHGLRVELR